MSDEKLRSNEVIPGAERCPHDYGRSENGHFDECHTCCKRELARLRARVEWLTNRFEDVVEDADLLLKSAPEALHPAILGIRTVADNQLGERSFDAPPCGEGNVDKTTCILVQGHDGTHYDGIGYWAGTSALKKKVSPIDPTDACATAFARPTEEDKDRARRFLAVNGTMTQGDPQSEAIVAALIRNIRVETERGRSKATPIGLGSKVYLRARRVGEVIAINERDLDAFQVRWGPSNGSETYFEFNRSGDLEPVERGRPDASPEPWPTPSPVTRDETIKRLCKLLDGVWVHFDPTGHEATDCFCGNNDVHANHPERFRSSGQALAWVESVVGKALGVARDCRERAPQRPLTPAERIAADNDQGDESPNASHPNETKET